MVTVPVLQDGNVKTEGFSGQFATDAPLAAFGGEQARSLAQTGAALDKIGESTLRIAQRVQSQQDRLQLLEVEKQLDSDELNWTKEWQSKRGKDAIGASAAVQEQFTAREKALMEQYGANSRIAPKLQEHLVARQKRVMTSVTGWETQQSTEYEKNLLVDRAQRAVESGISGYDPGNPAVFNEAVSKTKTTYASLGKLLGWDQEMIDHAARSDISKMHEGVINRLVGAGRGSEAASYLKSNKGSLDGDVLARVEKSVLDASVGEEARSVSDKISMMHQGDLAAQMKALDTIKDQKVRDAAEAYIVRRHSINEAIKKDAEEKVAREAYKIAGTNGEDGKPVELTVQQKEILGPTGEAAWYKLDRDRRSGHSAPLDRNAWAEFLSKDESVIAAMTPLQVMQQYGNKFDDATLDKAFNTITALRNKQITTQRQSAEDQRRLNEHASARSESEEVENFIKGASINDEKLKDRVRAMFDEAIAPLRKDGISLPEDRQNALKGITAKVLGSRWISNDRAFEMMDKGTFDGIPREFAPVMSAGAARRGILNKDGEMDQAKLVAEYQKIAASAERMADDVFSNKELPPAMKFYADDIKRSSGGSREAFIREAIRRGVTGFAQGGR